MKSPKSPKEIFVHNLIIFRKEKKYTQKKLAQLIGMPLSTYAHLESGRIPYTIINYINKITEVLEINHRQLFTDHQSTPPVNKELETIIQKVVDLKKRLS